ncbi:MAG TPA: TlpA disulfide reductase family protein [Gammaproteobacteria bacterium]|nr:TlpA disulfide reductase family protein [Gammaproteobacteria bacterium]
MSYRSSTTWGLGAALLLLVGAALHPAPAFAQDALDLEAYRGQIVWIDFWASWCTPCRRSFPWLNDMMAKYAGQGLVVVGVNVDTEHELAAQFLSEVPVSFSIVYDPQGALAQQYEVLGMPSSFLIGRDGRLISSHIGFRREERENYEASIVEALSN